jgi:multiple sugar transport system permease protein
VAARLDRWRQRVPIWGTYLILCALGLLVALPFVWMVASSVRSNAELLSVPLHWWVWPLQVRNYLRAVTEIPFARELGNTAMLSVACALGTTVTASMAGYAFARLHWPGRSILFWVLLATMFLPGVVTVVPVYLIFRDVGLLGTYLPLILPAWLAPPFSVFLLRQFLLTVSTSLSEAARLDGATEWQIFSRVILPVSRPALATVAVLTFVATWTDYLTPLIYLTSPNQWTLSIGLDAFVGTHSAAWNLLMAASVLFTVPLIVAFFLGQRYFVQGIQLSSSELG